MNKKSYEIAIRPHGDEGFDLDIRTAERMTGDDFAALKKYMEDEGYFEDATQYYS